MSGEVKKIKNLKISVEVHDTLKKYCDKNGIKMYRFLERMDINYIIYKTYKINILVLMNIYLRIIPKLILSYI